MLLKHFTWQQFLIAALILSLIWYGVVMPLLCRNSLKNLWKRKKTVAAAEPLAHEWDEELEDRPENLDDGLMGKPRLPEGMSKGSLSMLRFAGAEDAEDEHRERQQGLVPDVLEELKSIFQVLEKEQGTKDDFISLFGLVKAKYVAVGGTPEQAALNRYIRENALFPISDEELDHLWQ
ncbi:MAG: hypothetical protein JST32_05880 [Bacteroidetes bacterium]|nr:hypothetical protein [Bacteroidota bacterium]